MNREQENILAPGCFWLICGSPRNAKRVMVPFKIVTGKIPRKVKKFQPERKEK